MKLIELFSGIGGFSKGLTDAGYSITEHYFSEIDKHAIANYQYNFPNAKYIGDIRFVQSGDFKGIDIITFGSPCQDFSMAGKRKGLTGERSSLIEEAVRLVTDIRPGVFIWENVKGTFSSNSGADFWAILQAFTNIGDYRLEWQLLNTKWFLPQNRERIYFVGHLAGRSSGIVFPIGEEITVSNRRDAEKQTASCLGGSGAVQKDNVVVGTWRDFKGEVGLRKIKDTCSPTIPARAREDGSGQPVIQNEAGIRRLTEIECERLQGFPEQKLLICLEGVKVRA